MLVLAVLLTY